MTAVTSGCAGSSDQQQDMQLQAAQEKKSEEKESEKLKKVEEQIESLFKALEGPSVATEDAEEKQDDQQQDDQHKGSHQQDGQQQGQQQQDTQQGGQQKEDPQKQESKQQDGQQQKDSQKQGEKQQQGGQQQQDQQQQGQQTQDKWSQIDGIINNLHYQWNDLMPEIAKKGAEMKLIDNFDNSLNSLTTTIETKDRNKALTSANKLYSYIPDLYSLYRVKMSPEVKRMIYYSRNIILESEKENWEQVEKDNESLEKSWSLFRNTLEKEQKKTEDKLDFSIYELKKVSADKNKQLCGIKGKIVLNNIKELQKSFEDK